MPLPADADAHQNASSDAVACAAPGRCVSVGEYLAGGANRLDVATLANGSWTVAAAPMPPNDKAGDEPYFRAVKCPTVTWCTAVGQFKDASNNQQVFAMTLSGGVWTTTVLPQPPSSNSQTNTIYEYGLSCPVDGFCVAVGAYGLTDSNFAGYIETLSNGSWTVIRTPEPADVGSDEYTNLQGVDCASPTSCVASGSYRTTKDAAMLVTLSGTTWQATAAPLPPDIATYPNPSLYGVSCPAVGQCVVVGYYMGSHYENLIERQEGGTWTATIGPEPADTAPVGGSKTADASLNEVDCPTTSWCVAVGNYVNTGAADYSPEIDTFANGTWTAQAGPGMTPDDNDGSLDDLSCSWPGSCVATGGVDTDNGHMNHVLIDSLVDGTWAGNDTVLPADAQASQLSFATAPSCVAGTCLVGGSYTATSDYRGFLDTYPNLTGYQEVARDGGIFAFHAPFYGSMGGQPLNAPIVGSTAVPDSGGYYEVASDGGVFAFHAPFLGSMGGQPLNAPVVGIAFDTLTGGYYEVASDGGVFAFHAPFYGSMAGQHLNKPIVGMASDPLTGGYYEVAADGGVFAFHAPFYGSTGSSSLNKPMVGMTVNSSTGGYYEAAADGGVFGFHAPGHGSAIGQTLNAPIVGMAYDYVTGGYYEMASDGGIFAFAAPFKGSMGGQPLNQPVVAINFG